MPHTSFHVQEVTVCADGTVVMCHSRVPAALRFRSAGDSTVDMAQLVRVVWHPMMLVLQWHCVHCCNDGWSPEGCCPYAMLGWLGMAMLQAAGSRISSDLVRALLDGPLTPRDQSPAAK